MDYATRAVVSSLVTYSKSPQPSSAAYSNAPMPGPRHRCGSPRSKRTLANVIPGRTLIGAWQTETRPCLVHQVTSTAISHTVYITRSTLSWGSWASRTGVWFERGTSSKAQSTRVSAENRNHGRFLSPSTDWPGVRGALPKASARISPTMVTTSSPVSGGSSFHATASSYPMS